MPMPRNICPYAVFTTSSFNFGLPTYFASYYCYGSALCCVVKSFLKKSEQRCLTVVWMWQMKCQRSHICLCASSWISLLWFILKFNFVWLCQRLASLSFKKPPYTSNCLSSFFLEINVCIYPSLALHDSNIDSHE